MADANTEQANTEQMVTIQVPAADVAAVDKIIHPSDGSDLAAQDAAVIAAETDPAPATPTPAPAPAEGSWVVVRPVDLPDRRLEAGEVIGGDVLSADTVAALLHRGILAMPGQEPRSAALNVSTDAEAAAKARHIVNAPAMTQAAATTPTTPAPQPPTDVAPDPAAAQRDAALAAAQKDVA